MKKYFLAIAAAIVVSFQANAAYIQGVTGADMVGIEVTVELDSGQGILTESATWFASSATEGMAVGASDWILSLDGDSFGEYDDVNDILYGAFTFISYAYDVISITIEALDAGFVFDTEYGDASANGSGAGREFVSTSDSAVASYSDAVEDELFGTLTITGDFDFDTVYVFLTDTDAVVDSVPAPAGLALLGLALAGMRLARRNK